ncbi:MAG: hypothetical protein C4521_03915 [Actinobacteria bacterium]|nr:MAG: hypothetical protein C4521_03915 [Actinomycetota bacterium]
MARGKLYKYAKVSVIVGAAAALLIGSSGCGGEQKAGPETSATTAREATATSGSQEETEVVRAAPGKVIVTLYFSDANAEKLVREQREIPKTPAIAAAIIRELIKGPTDEGLYPTVPRHLKLLGVKMKGNQAVVNLSRVRQSGYGGTAAEMMMVYSIVNSLTELPNVKSVTFLVDGKKRDVLVDAFDVTEPVARDETLIGK